MQLHTLRYHHIVNFPQTKVYFLLTKQERKRERKRCEKKSSTGKGEKPMMMTPSRTKQQQ